MDFITSIPVKISKGKGILRFPLAIKQSPLITEIRCTSICLKANTKAKNIPFFVTCESSFFLDKNHEVNKNVLAVFKNIPSGNMIYFNTTSFMPLTTLQENLEIRVADFSDGSEIQSLDAVAVFEIQGKTANKYQL